jgi:hypothetical protein
MLETIGQGGGYDNVALDLSEATLNVRMFMI